MNIPAEGLNDDSSPDDSVTAPVLDVSGAVRNPTVTQLPAGYTYGVTRYADVILRASFGHLFADLLGCLEEFAVTVLELRTGGGNRTPFVIRFDTSLESRGWAKRSIEIGKTIDRVQVSMVRGHEIDMFAPGSEAEPYPGIAVEMEWNNKDPFFDRDLLNFQALHREGALAVGIIVTRGAKLQRLIKPLVRNTRGDEKFGESTTHWNKLVPRVNLGGGGECPLFLIGIEPDRVTDAAVLREAELKLQAAEQLKQDWRLTYERWDGPQGARHMYEAMVAEARAVVAAVDV